MAVVNTRCPYCGKDNSSDNKFCIFCGNAIGYTGGVHKYVGPENTAMPIAQASPVAPAPAEAQAPPPPAPMEAFDSMPQIFGGAPTEETAPAQISPQMMMPESMSVQTPVPVPPVFSDIASDVGVYFTPNHSDIPSNIPDAPELYGETQVLGALEDNTETTVLSNFQLPQLPNASISRLDTGEEIRITKELFVIGRSASQCDYAVSGHTVISRRHAQIVYDKNVGLWYIMDFGSSNKTCVNGMQIAPLQTIVLNSGDRFRLADMDFVFMVR